MTMYTSETYVPPFEYDDGASLAIADDQAEDFAPYFDEDQGSYTELCF